MKILAIDPGPTQSAWVFWDTEKHDFCDYPRTTGFPDKGIRSNEELLCWLSIEANDGFCPIELVAIETPQNYGVAIGRTTFETLMMVGMLRAILEDMLTYKLYGRPTIKGQIGGRTDAEIHSSLRMRYGEARKGEKLEGVKKDIWSALALAVALEEKPDLKEW